MRLPFFTDRKHEAQIRQLQDLVVTLARVMQVEPETLAQERMQPERNLEYARRLFTRSQELLRTYENR